MSKLMPAPGAATRAGAEPAPEVWMPAFDTEARATITALLTALIDAGVLAQP